MLWPFAEHGPRGFCDLMFVESGTVCRPAST